MSATDNGMRVAVRHPTGSVSGGVLYTAPGSGKVDREALVRFPQLFVVPEGGPVQLHWSINSEQREHYPGRAGQEFAPDSQGRRLPGMDLIKVGDPTSIDGTTHSMFALLRTSPEQSAAEDLDSLPIVEIPLLFHKSQGVVRNPRLDEGLPVAFSTGARETGLGIWQSSPGDVAEPVGKLIVTVSGTQGNFLTLDFGSGTVVHPNKRPVKLDPEEMPVVEVGNQLALRSIGGDEIWTPPVTGVLSPVTSSSGERVIKDFGPLAQLKDPVIRRAMTALRTASFHPQRTFDTSIGWALRPTSEG